MNDSSVDLNSPELKLMLLFLTYLKHYPEKDTLLYRGDPKIIRKVFTDISTRFRTMNFFNPTGIPRD